MSENENGPESPLTSSVQKLRQDLDRWLEVAVSQGERALDRFGLRDASRTWSPAIDVIEKPEEVLIRVDLPGVTSNSVEITLCGNMLTIKGESPTCEAAEGETVQTCERRHGEFSRSVPLPVPVNSDEVSAETNNGVLSIRLMKSEAAKPKQIEIRVPSSE